MLSDDNQTWINYRRFNPYKYYIYLSGEINETGMQFYGEANTRRVKIDDTVICFSCVNAGSSSYLNCWTTNGYDVRNYRKIGVEYVCTSVSSGTGLIFGIPSYLPSNHTKPTMIIEKYIPITDTRSIFVLDISNYDIADAYLLFHSQSISYQISISAIFLYND